MDNVTELKKMCRDLEESFTNSKMLYHLSLISQVDPNNYKRAAAAFRKYTMKLTKDMKAFRKLSIVVAHAMPKRRKAVKAEAAA